MGPQPENGNAEKLAATRYVHSDLRIGGELVALHTHRRRRMRPPAATRAQ